ncbi:MAG: 3-deoxy-D-manno-octulosonic acid transferase [Flavobacteriales bacterium]
MISLLYEFGLNLYMQIAKLVSLKKGKAKKWVEGRKGLFPKIEKKIDSFEKYDNFLKIWIHCASLGEFEQAAPLMKKFKESNKVKIIVTFFSPSGYEVRKDHSLPDAVFYLPIDTRKNANRFINIIRPDLSIFVKYEFWRNYMIHLHKKNIPTILISAFFRREQQFFKWYGVWGRQALRSFDHILTRNEDSNSLLKELGIRNFSLGGDTRYDKVYSLSRNAERIPLIENFKGDELLFVVGSSWPEDEEVILPVLRRSSEKMKIIIAPHEVDDAHLKEIENNVNSTTIRYSELNSSSFNERVLLIDNIGMLASLYKYSDISFVGGGFHTGIHNILEPASFGVPVMFGKNYDRFPEAHELLRINAVYNIEDEKDFTNKLTKLLNDKNERQKMGEACKNYVLENKGATDLAYKKCLELLEKC